jgi:aryl-alcohol dehydrogenase-like predicted oxidoreductase
MLSRSRTQWSNGGNSKDRLSRGLRRRIGVQQLRDEGRREALWRGVGAALDAGINFFDTADMYANGKSEELVGRFLGGHRRHVLIATNPRSDTQLSSANTAV